MFSEKHKKEMPILGMLGMGGGVGSALIGGGGVLSGLEASGGTVSDYESGSNIYRAHVFTSNGTFQVTAINAGLPATVDVLVVGGGGGGGHNIAAGGGAGGLRSLTNVPVASTGTYPVTIGNGGAGSSSNAVASNGNNTT